MLRISTYPDPNNGTSRVMGLAGVSDILPLPPHSYSPDMIRLDGQALAPALHQTALSSRVAFKVVVSDMSPLFHEITH